MNDITKILQALEDSHKTINKKRTKRGIFKYVVGCFRS